MRTLLIRLVPVLVAALLFVGRMPAQLSFDSVSLIASPSIAAAQDAPAKPGVDVNIKVDRNWYTDPTVLLIGGGALVLLIALIAFASRGGGTTIIREK